MTEDVNAASAVCEWRQHHRTETGVKWKAACGVLLFRQGKVCPSCDKIIKFTEVK